MTVHVIKLRDHWQAVVDETHTRVSRNFGAPRRTNEHVLLVATVSHAGAVKVNEHETTIAAGRMTLDITEALQPRNRVTFTLPAAGAVSEVAIEMHAVIQ
jgi:hypothetical protein